ncbi:hypothetical protein [Colwellia psychrerythraea]|uniref:hypothetical protein n=1 Tax=Colwellia psychrerythraea TaxID=28229 RepID=UPI00031FB270|nr:hypothetical protein [Colwellia psychrerythraea]
MQQFKCIALASGLTQDNSTQANKSKNTAADEDETVEIAGYLMNANLLDELAGQNINKLADFDIDFHWFEWQAQSEELSPSRIKQQQALANKNNKLLVQQVDDVKFWQATELQIAQSFLTQEQLIFSQLAFSILVLSKTETN